MTDNQQVTVSGIEALLAPFPKDQVQQRKGPGGMEFDYVPAEVMIRRLVDSGLEYSFTQVPGCPPQIMSHGNGVNVMLYYGRLHIPALGPAQDDVGTAFIHPSGNEEQYKSAASDCLKRCARLYGIGLEMWEGDPNERNRGRSAMEYAGPPQADRPAQQTAAPRYTNSSAPSDGATDRQVSFIHRLTKERFPMDNDEFNEKAVQQIWTMELKQPGTWGSTRQGTSQLIDYLMATPKANEGPSLQL